MRFSPEKDDPENAGLHIARDVLEPLKKKHPNVSYADLWVYAAYVFIADSGGPSIEFEPGRVDKTEKDCIENGRLPQAEFGVDEEKVDNVDEEGRICGWEKNAQHVKDIFYRMGLDTREAVALLCGGHVYGRCHTENSGYAGPWVEEPWQFSNEYAADMIEDDWQIVTNDSKVQGCPVHQEIRPAAGKKQYVGVQIPPESAPDAEEYPPGLYEITTTWVNVREDTDTKSKIIGQPKTGTKMMLDQVKVFGTAIRGHLDYCVVLIEAGAETILYNNEEWASESSQTRLKRTLTPTLEPDEADEVAVVGQVSVGSQTSSVGSQTLEGSESPKPSPKEQPKAFRRQGTGFLTKDKLVQLVGKTFSKESDQASEEAGMSTLPSLLRDRSKAELPAVMTFGRLGVGRRKAPADA